MEEEKNGLTLKGVFNTIWLKKWIALIVAVVVVLVSAVSLFYGYNRHVKYYTMEFSLNLPGGDNGVVYIYPNGSQLYYSDMTSEKTLKAIKSASGDAFADIDVEAMATKGQINIERNIKSLVEDNANQSSYKEITYTITAKASCFSNAAQARQFLAAIAYTPVGALKSMEINYGVYLNNFDIVDNYEKQIELLKDQLKLLTDGYSSLISTYGEGIVVEKDDDTNDKRTLFAYAHDVELYVESNELENLLTKVQTEHILKSETSKQSYELEAIRLKEQLDDAEKTLTTLTTSDKSYTDGASIIKEQQDLVNELTRRKEVVDAFVDPAKGKVDESFETEIQKAYGEVEKLTGEYSKTSKTVYSSASSVVYIQPGIVSVQGGMSLVKILLLSVVVGVLVALVAAYVAGYLSLKKKKAAAEAPSEEAPQAQTAVEAEAHDEAPEKENKE